MDRYLQQTPILDFQHPRIQQLIDERGWLALPEKQRIQAAYLFVKDEILFGYNEADDIKASVVLADGYGQCNTKSTLFMALLRAVNIPCRIHGFTIDKALQKGAISGIWYTLAPQNILHSWVEVLYNGQWYNLEGIILDQAYLSCLQSKFKEQAKNFCGYGAYTEDLNAPQTDWNENNTYIQKLGINNDFGLFNDPDSFYNEHQQKLSPIKTWVYRNITRHSMNRNIERIRSKNS